MTLPPSEGREIRDWCFMFFSKVKAKLGQGTLGILRGTVVALYAED